MSISSQGFIAMMIKDGRFPVYFFRQYKIISSANSRSISPPIKLRTVPTVAVIGERLCLALALASCAAFLGQPPALAEVTPSGSESILRYAPWRFIPEPESSGGYLSFATISTKGMVDGAVVMSLETGSM